MTSEEAVYADLKAPVLRAGAISRRWRIVRFKYPLLVVAVTAAAQMDAPSEYCFRLELSNYPEIAPEVRIWDPVTDSELPVGARPSGTPRIQAAFKQWGGGTVYRPWDRLAGAHSDWAIIHPTMTWNGTRTLTFILEDLHGLLTSTAVRAAA